MRQAEAGPVGCKWADGWHEYLGSADKAAHPYAAPLVSSRLSNLPPTLILTAEDDMLRDESLCYARRLRAAGVAVVIFLIVASILGFLAKQEIWAGTHGEDAEVAPVGVLDPKNQAKTRRAKAKQGVAG